MTIVGGGGELTSGKVAFKSKVVSRSHAEIWCQAGGKVNKGVSTVVDTDESSSTSEIRPAAQGHS